jgi:tryptophan-rich sensory protein
MTNEAAIDRNRDFLGFATIMLIVLTTAGVEGIITRNNLEGWYDALHKPFFTPPDWAFPLVWNLLFVLMGVACWRVWRRPASPERTRALLLFAVQLLFNFLWTTIFFGLHRIGVALLEACLLLGLIHLTARALGRCDRWAELLFWPYLAWVAFAVLLNAGIWWLNPAA